MRPHRCGGKSHCLLVEMGDQSRPFPWCVTVSGNPIYPGGRQKSLRLESALITPLYSLYTPQKTKLFFFYWINMSNWRELSVTICNLSEVPLFPNFPPPCYNGHWMGFCTVHFSIYCVVVSLLDNECGVPPF